MNLLTTPVLYGLAIVAALSTAVAGVQTVRLKWHQSAVTRSLVEASENARELERLANRSNTRVTDELNKANARAAAAGALASKRLRDLAAARSEAAAACSRIDEPAAGILPERTREDLESEAKRADQVVRNMTALQAYVRDVCKPESK